MNAIERKRLHRRRDSLQLHDPARPGQVRHNDIRGLAFEQFAKGKAGFQQLARTDRRFRFQGDPGHCFEACHRDRVLDPHELVIAQRLGQPEGRGQVKGAVTVNAQVYLVPDGVVQYIGTDRMEDWTEFYAQLFGFADLPDEERFGILPKGRILRSPCGTFFLQLIEPEPGILEVDGEESLQRVGLGYIHIGQPATTLSGGEAQRVKLAKELARRATGRTLYILDEPTTGLHFEDVRKLLDVLRSLVDQGNTIVVIEHNMEVIKTADWIIDLGPEGGDKGGRVVAVGTPEDVAAAKGSYTGQYLASHLRHRLPVQKRA